MHQGTRLRNGACVLIYRERGKLSYRVPIMYSMECLTMKESDILRKLDGLTFNQRVASILNDPRWCVSSDK